MVLKVDHISYSCDKKTDVDCLLPKSFVKEFEEKNLINADCKSEFLALKSQVHSIVMYVSEGNIPVEVTQYPETEGINRSMLIDNRKVYWKVKNIMAAKELFICLGATEGEEKEELILKPFLDNEISIIFLKDDEETANGFLDVEGFSSIGFFVDNIKKERKKLSEKGFYTSMISDVDVNGKKLQIVFARGKNNEIVELISYTRRNNEDN